MCAPALPYVPGCHCSCGYGRRSGDGRTWPELSADEVDTGATPPFADALVIGIGEGWHVFTRSCHPPTAGSLPAMDPYGKVVRAMLRPATLVLMGLASAAAIAHAFWGALSPASGGNPVLDLIAYHDPGFHTVIRVWYYVAPAVAVVLAGSLGLSVWRVWLQPRAGGGAPGHVATLARLARGRDTIGS